MVAALVGLAACLGGAIGVAALVYAASLPDEPPASGRRSRSSRGFGIAEGAVHPLPALLAVIGVAVALALARALQQVRLAAVIAIENTN